MNIALINGSPKLGESNSGFLLRTLQTKLQERLQGDCNITQYNISKKPLAPEQYAELCRTDALVLVFPLYIDAIPSHLFRMLVTLEDYLKKETHKNIRVYALVNNGFYEGHQNHVAINIIENWSARCGLTFGMGVGHGAGEMLGVIQNIPMGHGPFTNMGRAMDALVHSIGTQSGGETILISPNFPRFAWKFSATQFWHSTAGKNGLKRKDIVRKIQTL